MTWRQSIRARDVEPSSNAVVSPPTLEPPISSGGVRPGNGALPLSRVGPGQQRRPPYRPRFTPGRSGPPNPPISSAPTAMNIVGAAYYSIDVEMETSCNTFAGLIAVQGTNNVFKSVRYPVAVPSDRPSGQTKWKKEPLPMLPPKSRGQAPVHREWNRPPPSQRPRLAVPPKPRFVPVLRPRK